jgi:UDP-N-acetylmuramyl pentapeptide synthase
MDLAEAGQWLSATVKPGDIVLFKGSRTAAVEKAMHAAFPNP